VKHTQYSKITVAAWTEEIPGTHLYNPEGMHGRGGSTRPYQLSYAVKDLAEGGYIIDLRPIADNENITHEVFQAPMPNGDIEKNDIDRLPESVRECQESRSGYDEWTRGSIQRLCIFSG